MASPEERQKIHKTVLLHFMETGRAPHYTEVAETMEITPENARQLVRQTIQESPFSFAWMAPDTDFISSWAPFSSLPNHHLISVDGVQKWYGQGGLEALAVSHLFPGRKVSIDTRCLHSGNRIHLVMRDSDILEISPDEPVGYSVTPPDQWGHPTWAYTGSTMNLFRSGEDTRAWADFNPKTEKTIKPVREWAAMFQGAELFRRRLDDDFVAKSEEYTKVALGALGEAVG